MKLGLDKIVVKRGFEERFKFLKGFVALGLITIGCPHSSISACTKLLLY